MTVSAIVLDLDSVIIKTNLIKYRTVLSLFAEHTDLHQQISDYILAHGGIPRREKFTAILRDLLKTTPTVALLTHDLQRYIIASVTDIVCGNLWYNCFKFEHIFGHHLFNNAKGNDAINLSRKRI